MNPLENLVCNKLENDGNENKNEEFVEEEVVIDWEGEITRALE